MMNSWVTNGLGEGRRSFSEIQKVKNRPLYREEAIRGKSSINGQITYFSQTSEDCLCGNFEGNSFSLQDVSMGRQKQRNKEEQQGCIRKHGHFNSKYNYRTPLISLYPSVAMETESSGLFAGIEEQNYLEETNRVLQDLVNIRVKKQTERLGGYLKTNSETKGERAIRKGRENNTTLPGIVERHGIRKSFETHSDSWRPETNLMPNSNGKYSSFPSFPLFANNFGRNVPFYLEKREREQSDGTRVCEESTRAWSACVFPAVIVDSSVRMPSKASSLGSKNKREKTTNTNATLDNTESAAHTDLRAEILHQSISAERPLSQLLYVSHHGN